MANSAEFRDLIYRSADPTAPINDNTKVDRLLGIKPNGEAVVVDISGNNTVALRSDAPDIEVVKRSMGTSVVDSATSNDEKVYSCKATSYLIADAVPGLVMSTDRFSDYDDNDYCVYSCAAITELLGGGTGGSGGGTGGGGESGGLTISDVQNSILESNYESSTQSNTKTYTCKAIRDYVSSVVSELSPSSGGSTTTDTFWVADSGDSSYIKPKNSKSISTGGQNLKVGGGDIIFTTSSGNVSLTASADGAMSTPYFKVPKLLSTAGMQSQAGIETETFTANSWAIIKGDLTVTSSSGPTLTVQGAIETGSGGATIHSPMLKLALSSSVSADITYDGQKVNVTAPLYASSFYESSDISLKENVAPMSDQALSAASSIPLVEFDWKSTGKHSYGTIAQEVAKVMPEIVETDEEGKKSVNYIALLCAKVAALEKEVAQLKANQNG